MVSTKGTNQVSKMIWGWSWHVICERILRLVKKLRGWVGRICTDVHRVQQSKNLEALSKVHRTSV